MKQNALTLVTTVQSQKLDNLRIVLKEKNDMLKNALRSIGTVHYARWVIIDEKILEKETLAPQLAFSSNFDGTPEQHMQDLVQTLGNLIDAIYSNCDNFTPTDKVGFFKKIRIPEMAFYQGSPGRSVKTIAQERELYEKLFSIKNSKNWEGQSAVSIHRQLQQQIFSDPKFDWAKQKIHTPKVNWLALVLFGIVVLIISPLIILWALYIQLFHERFDKPLGLDRNQLSDEHITKMQLDEDYVFQNQFSQIIDMKPGKARLFTLNLLYLFARILIKIFFVEGKLMGIPTIHFARWVMVNDKKRMLFFSNFDGSWTQYLGDFIDKSGWGLTGIFGNTQGFPRALFLIFKGAYNQQKFLAWSRNTQIATQLWYAADTSQSIKNINNNTIIRNELASDLNETQASKFLSRI